MNAPIRIYTTAWCPDCRQAKKFLRAHDLAFEEIDIDDHPEAVDFVRRANDGKRRVPTFDVGGRVFHCSPFNAQKLTRELGL
jgi:mycoredoxin